MSSTRVSIFAKFYECYVAGVTSGELSGSNRKLYESLMFGFMKGTNSVEIEEMATAIAIAELSVQKLKVPEASETESEAEPKAEPEAEPAESEPAEPETEPTESEPAEPAESEPAEPAGHVSKEELISAMRETLEMREVGAPALALGSKFEVAKYLPESVEEFLTVQRARFSRGHETGTKRVDPDWLSTDQKFPLLELSTALEADCGARLVAAGSEVGKTIFGGRSSSFTIPDLYVVSPNSGDPGARMEIVARAIELVGRWAASVSDDLGDFWVIRGPEQTIFAQLRSGRYTVRLHHEVWASVGNLVAGFGLGNLAFASDGAQLYESPMGRLARLRRLVVLDPSTYNGQVYEEIYRGLDSRFALVLPGAGSLSRRCARYAEAEMSPIFPGLQGQPTDQYSGGNLVRFINLCRHRKNHWAGALKGEVRPSFFAQPKELILDPRTDPRVNHIDIRKRLAGCIAERLVKVPRPLPFDYFRVPADPDVWAGYCLGLVEGSINTLAAVGSGVEVILNEFACRVNSQASFVQKDPVASLLHKTQRPAPKKNIATRAKKLIEAAKEYMTKGHGVEAPPEFNADAAPTISGPIYPGEIYSCAGYPYTYERNEFDALFDVY